MFTLDALLWSREIVNYSTWLQLWHYCWISAALSGPCCNTIWMHAFQTRKHSSRMYTAHLCQLWCFNSHHGMSLQGGGHQISKFKKVSNDDHQMSLADGGQGLGVPCLMSWGGLGLRALYSQVQCIMGNGHMGTPCKQADRQTWLKTLPSHNFIGGGNNTKISNYWTSTSSFNAPREVVICPLHHA